MMTDLFDVTGLTPNSSNAIIMQPVDISAFGVEWNVLIVASYTKLQLVGVHGRRGPVLGGSKSAVLQRNVRLSTGFFDQILRRL